MVMGTKYCLLCSASLEDMLEVGREGAQEEKRSKRRGGAIGEHHRPACACSRPSLLMISRAPWMISRAPWLAPAPVNCYWQVTLRHLAGARALVVSATVAASPDGTVDVATMRLISNAEDATQRFYGGLGAGELLLLRATLARFLQDKRVR